MAHPTASGCSNTATGGSARPKAQSEGSPAAPLSEEPFPTCAVERAQEGVATVIGLTGHEARVPTAVAESFDEEGAGPCTLCGRFAWQFGCFLFGPSARQEKEQGTGRQLPDRDSSLHAPP